MAVRTAQATIGAAGAATTKRKFSWTPYLFILPHLIFFAVFVCWPFINGLAISLQQYDYLRPAQNQFIGLQNYVDLFSPGTLTTNEFWDSMKNTGIFVLVSVPPLVVVPLLLAVLLNTKIPGRNLFRTIYFAPWVLSVAVVGLLWWWIFQSSGGLMNYYLSQIGVTPPRWLSSLPWAWIAITIATVWWTIGFNMIILLAALQDIPDQLYEAASLDGATPVQTFFRVTLPMLRPVLLFVVTITIIASFNLFGQPFIMTNGGPPQANGTQATTPVMYRIYIQGFTRPLQGSAAAMSFVVAMVMVIVSFLNFKIFRQRDV
ncbi:MAG: sugar ABC transporter permease [Chloroflexota bacterium]|nr:sugar ABC transporter permease [Chloroflexota bacterium]